MTRSFRVDPAYLESIESGLLAQMTGKNPAYLDWLSYPYDEASFTTVDGVISGKQSKDGYLTKDCCTWQFNAYDDLSLDALSDVDLSGNPDIVLPLPFVSSLDSAGLVYDAATQMWTPQHISAQNFRYFAIDSGTDSWFQAHPNDFAFYKGPWDAVYLPLLGQPFARPYGEWSFDEDDSAAGRWIRRWLDTGPTWSADYATWGGPTGNINQNISRVMQAQQFARRPLASWDCGAEADATPGSVVSNSYFLNSSPWHILGTQTGTGDPVTDYASYDFLDFYASGKGSTRFGFGETSPIQRLHGILHEGGRLAGMDSRNVLSMQSGGGSFVDYDARNPGDTKRLLRWDAFTASTRFYPDTSTQLWPLTFLPSQDGSDMNGDRGFVHTGLEERLADSTARTRLLVMARMAEKSADSTTAAKATFDELTTRLDLLHEVAEWAHSYDAGRLGPHSRAHSDWDALDGSLAYLEGVTDRNAILPDGVTDTNLDLPEGRDRNLLVRYNETGWGGPSSKTARRGLRRDELGKEFAHGENMALKAWYPELLNTSFNVFGALRINGTGYMSGLGAAAREPNNWAANSGDMALSVNGSDEWSAALGTNVSQVYVNWIRPMPMPSPWREDGLLGLGNDQVYFIENYTNATTMSGTLARVGSAKSPFEELVGNQLGATGRTREYVSITIYWDRPQPSDMYDVVAFPGTDMERSIPCPLSDWRALQAIDGTDKDGYPLKDENTIRFFKEWGWEDEFWSWDSSTSQLVKVFDLAEAVGRREVYPDNLTAVNYAPLGDDWIYGEGRFPSFGVTDCWMPGPTFETIKFINTNDGAWGGGTILPSRHMFFTKSSQENPDAVISTSDAQPISGPLLGDLVHPTRSDRFRHWGVYEWIHVAKDHPAVLDHTTATPPYILENAWTEWGGGLAYEPLLRQKDNSTYKNVSTNGGASLDPHNVLGGAEQLSWTRCLAKEKAFCTLLVPKDWWDLQRQGAVKTVPFQARHIRPKGMGIGLTSPTYIFPDFLPAGVETSGGFSGDDYRWFYTEFGFSGWPESFKPLGSDGLFAPDHEANYYYLKPSPTAAQGGDDIQYSWMDLQTAADMGYMYPYATNNRAAAYRFSYVSTPSGQGEALWYVPGVDHWGTLRKAGAFKSPNAYVDEWAKRQIIQPIAGHGDLTAYEPSTGVLTFQQYGSRQNITEDARGIPRFVSVSAVTFPFGVKFRSVGSAATTPCQGNEVVLQVWGTNDPTLLTYVPPFGSSPGASYYDLGDPLRRSGSDPLTHLTVALPISSTSTNPADWEIPAGTTITFPSPVYAVVPDVTWDCPGLALAFSSPTPGKVDGTGKSQQWFDTDGPVVVPAVLSDTQLGQSVTPGAFDPSQTVWTNTNLSTDPRVPVIWTTDADKSGVAAENTGDLGCAGEGWGYNPNDFGRHGTPLWAGQAADPWLDPEGILRTQNQEDSGFGASNTPCSD